jgi:hypothetical protein
VRQAEEPGMRTPCFSLEVMKWSLNVCSEVLRCCFFRHSCNKRLIETVLIGTENKHFVRTKTKERERRRCVRYEGMW